jgi:hypothetical protein
MPYSSLLVLLPGETPDATAPGGKTGSPTAWTAGDPYPVRVLAMNSSFQPVTWAPADSVQLSTTDPYGQVPGPQAMSGGSILFYPDRLFSAGSTAAFEALDPAAGISGTSSAVAIVSPGLCSSYLYVSASNLAPQAASAGQKAVPLLALNFQNPGASGSFTLKGVTLTVEDGSGQPLAGRLAALSAQGASGPVGSVSGAQASLYLPFSASPDTALAPGASTSLKFYGDLSSSNDPDSFRLVLASLADLAGEQPCSSQPAGFQPQPAPAASFSSSQVTVLKSQASESFRAFPNPFSSNREVQNLDFSLVQDAEVSLKIYTLQGALVRTLAEKSRLQGDGRKLFTWDGRNGEGSLVVNGVYLAVLEVGGLRSTLKLAVLK